MRFLSAAVLLILTTFAISQDKLCDAASASTVDHDAGVIVQKVTLSGKRGSNDATVYLPDKEIADGAVAFSHSAIHADDGSQVDLLPFALRLAHAGAVVIVPARALLWPPRDQVTNREGPVVICAEHWLIDHTKVFNNGEPTLNDNKVVRRGYAYVGPRLCDPALPDCKFMSPFYSEDCGLKHYCRENVWVSVGETGRDDSTHRILSDQGSKAANWIQRQLGLAPISTQ
ncbi:MAG: hypothetical protein ABSE57_24745 [Bryobacteraceae bacterium]|jgi:hypothetical protein